MIDTHCHLYSGEFKEDIETVVERAESAGVTSFYLPAIDSSTHDAMIALETHFEGRCFSMIGLHPCSVKENYRDELDIVKQWLARKTFVAIGETGLDLYWDKTFENEQRLALKEQIELALQYDLPLILHTREAMQQTIDVVKEYKGTGLRGIFHCFGGSLKEAEQIIETGFLLGIGGVVTYKNGGLDAVLPNIGTQHLVLETDAPYLAPVPFRGKRNESGYLGYIAERIALLTGMALEDVIADTTKNATELFSSKK